MAKYLPLPDGSSLKVPDSMSYEEAMRKAQAKFPELFAEAAPETPEPTARGQVKEFFKGLIPGAIGMVESAAVGASALLPEEQEKAAREAITGLATTAKKPFEAAPGYEETVGRKFGQAAGSVIPFVGLGPFGLAGRVGMAGLGAGAGAGEARVRAEQEGGMGQRGLATVGGALVGISEMFAPARILGRVAEPAKAGAVTAIKRALLAGGEEAAQEAASQAAQNLIAKGLYKPDQEIIEQVGESAAYGGATGALVQGLLDLALGRRVRGQAAAETARVAAEQAEAARNTPEALLKLNDDFSAAQQQMRALQTALPQKPKKDATDEEKAAYTTAQDALKTFKAETYEPLLREYNQRKPQIQQALGQIEARQMEMEQAAAPTQEAAIKPISTAVFEPPVVNLMEQHDALRDQLTELEKQVRAAEPEQYSALKNQFVDLERRTNELGDLITQRGGVPMSLEQFQKESDARLKKLQKDFEENRDKGETDKAEELANQLIAARQEIAQKRQLFEEKARVAATPRGETFEMFGPKEAAAPTAPQPTEVVKEEAEPEQKAAIFDLFSDYNLIQTAIRNNDPRALAAIARDAERKKLKTLDEQAAERQRLAEVLDKRLDVAGVKRQRSNLFGKIFSPEQQAMLTNGTYPEREIQALYDKGGPQAVEYDYVMKQVEDLRKKVEAKQGNAKKSWLQEMLDLEAEHQQLLQQMQTGVAVPTMREKVAGVQAKLGKGEAPAERQMDASERHNLQRKIDAVVKRFNMIADTKVKPVRDQIMQAYAQLYEDVPVAKPSKVAAEKAAAAEAEGRAPKSKSRAAATAARIERGDVRKEAEESQKMRDLARDLGENEAEYKKFETALTKKLEALKKRYGADDPAVAQFRSLMGQERLNKAVELGRQTPEYKATLKEQIEFMREGLKGSKQEVPSKRTTQVTRKITGAPRQFRSATPESREETQRRTLRIKGGMSEKDIEAEIKAAKEQADVYSEYDDETRTAFRVREEAGGSIDPKEAQTFIDKVKANLPEGIKFVYAPTPAQIPVRLLRNMQAQGMDPTTDMVQGGVFPDGTVLIVGDQHANLRDLEETVLHEFVGHYGIDTLVGIKALQAYADKTDLRALAEQLGGENLLSEMQRVGAAMQAQGEPESVQRLQVLRELIAHTEEARVTEGFREKAGRWLKELVGMVRAALRNMGFTKLPELSTSDVYYMLRNSRKDYEAKRLGPYRAADGQIAFRSRKQPVGIAKSFVAVEPKLKDTLMGNFLGLSGRVQFVDQFAALSKAYKLGEEKGLISSVDAANAEFALRFGQNVSQYATEFLTSGAVRRIADPKGPKGSYIYESRPGANMLKVAEALNKSGIENDTEAEAMFTAYVAGQRAEAVGWNKLNFTNPALAQKEYNDVLAYLNANPKADTAFKEATKIYKEYNDGLIDFLVQTGALTNEKAAELKSRPYVPFYRVDGESLNLFVDKEHPIRIGNVKDRPELRALVGGNQQIMPIFTSAVQNAFILTRMGLRNQLMKEAAFRLNDMGIASRVGPGQGPAGPSTVRFMVKGKPHFAIIDQDQFGLPAELIIKGLEGIKTSLPKIFEVMGYPADVLRKFVTRAPVYAVRQMIRDPLNAWMTNATSGVPVLNSFKELSAMVAGRSDVERKLMATGAISTNVLTGDQRDMTKALRDITAGKSGWTRLIAKADAFAMQGDAATRAVIYKDSLAKGMTEQQALLRTLEATNFQRRGLSPTMQALSILIPFFNAQIQGLDVLYRSFKGDMPFNDKLQIQQKLFTRGLLLAAGTMAYAAMMDDDEAYKRAKPEERLGNWFVYVPGLDEPVRVPIPFELGYLFKALPEALYHAAKGDRQADEAITGMKRLIDQTIPLTLPQAIKPLTEVVLGKSFYSGDIESTREQALLGSARYRDTTTELAKLIGSVTGDYGLSPIKIDYLIRGYTSGLGIALVQLANPILATEAKAPEPTTKLSKMPFIGGFFQPVEGRGTLDYAYQRMEEIQQTKATFNKLVEDGKGAEARQFAQDYADRLALASTSGAIYRQLGMLAKQERQIRAAPNLTAEQKDAMLKRLDAAKNAIAENFLTVIEKTKPQ